MKIGETVKFTGIYEGDESKPYSLTGTVADIRDGHAFVFCLGQRWPFTIAMDDTTRRGYYPRTMDVAGHAFPFGLTVEQMEQTANSLEGAFERCERAGFGVHIDAVRAIRQLLPLLKEPPVYRDFSNDETCCGYCHRAIGQDGHHASCAWARAASVIAGQGQKR